MDPVIPQPISEETTLDNILKEFMDIKKTGVECTVKEARPFYNNICKLEQEKYIQVMSVSLMNFSQNIPITKVNEESLSYIVDDLDLMQETAMVYQQFLQLSWGLYHQPTEYLAWKGTILDKIAYYVEPKGKKVETEMYL